MAPVDEKTPLLKDNSDPTIKLYSKRNRSFYVCLFAAVGVLIFVAFVAAIWYIFELKSNTSSISPENQQDLNVLLQNEWPRPDAEVQVIPYGALITLINEAVDEGKLQLQVRQLKDEYVTPLDSDSPTYKHQQSIVYSPTGSNLSNYGYVETVATKYLRDKGVKSVVNYGSAPDLKWADETDCHHLNDSIPCEPTPYRSISGSCNNLENPQTWGVAMTPFRRAMAPAYEDGVSVPRGGFETSLPSARDVSTKIHRPIYQKDENFTVMLAVWGQFLDHDLTATALSRGVNGTPITCCNSKIQHPECFPVLLSSNDTYYSKYDLACMEFVRSAPALRCSFGPREQLNQASSYIDGSMIYGNTESLASRLRSFNNGELEMSYTKEGRALLPVTTDPIDGCNQLEEIKKGRYCFLSGDTRANENTHLTSMHLILARQHNKIANLLQAFNPFWDDEVLYQEARRIVTAQLQHITYNELLPAILGEQLMVTLDLYSYKTGYWTKYNNTVDPTISNNFAAASFRFAHTLIPRMFKMLANDTESPEYVEMHKMLFNPFGLYDGELDSIIRGAFNTSVEKADNYFTEELTEHLFESTSSEKPTKKSFGLDLVSLNIQRGRDHGLPPYPKWREYCNLSSVHSYDDLRGIFDEESLTSVSKLYNSVDDIDLYTGALSEIPIAGGLLGPTFTCLIADQFYRLKHGDRYWYETNEKPQAFTPEQLDEIRKTTLAGIICQNADDLQMVTPSVMRSSKENNELIPCSQVPQPNISVWRVSPENTFGLNVIRLRIELPKRVFTWSNESQAEIPPEVLPGGRLTSFVSRRTVERRQDVVELDGQFTYVAENGAEVAGLFELTAETSTYVDVTNMKIRFPVYLTHNQTADGEKAANSSRIIFHTIPTASSKVVWTGNVTIDLIPLSWHNVSDSASRSNDTHKTESSREAENPAEKTAESASSGSEWVTEGSEPGRQSGGKDAGVIPRPAKRGENKPSSQAKKDYQFFKKNGTSDGEKPQQEKSEEQVEGDDEIYTVVPDLAADTNSSDQDNVLYHIVDTVSPNPSNDTTVEKDELDYLRQLTPDSSIYLDGTQEARPTSGEQITPLHVSVKSADLEGHPTIVPPTEIPIGDLQNRTVVWHLDSAKALNGSFEIPHRGRNGTFWIKSGDNDLLGKLHPGCKYYSKIVVDIPANRSSLYDNDDFVDITSAGDASDPSCTVILPIQLHGNMTSPKTFGWDGNATLYARQASATLAKEDELSLHLSPNRVLSAGKIDGTVSFDEGGPSWNGSFPVLINVSEAAGAGGWSAWPRVVAYPVTWSGAIEDSRLEGSFALLEKAKSSVERRGGKFSLNLASLNGTTGDLIRPFTMHQSVVYLTEKLSYIGEVDVSRFDAIDEWDSKNASGLVLVGEFVPDEFRWSGETVLIFPPSTKSETTAATAAASDSYAMSTYRPHGKYLTKILEGTLFAVLDRNESVLKWWTGVVPQSVVIPAGESHTRAFKTLFNNAILWTYENSNNSEQHATFKTYGTQSKVHLFGDFRFEASSLLDDIKTSVLRPNVDYYSPLVLQGATEKYNVETDLVAELSDLRDPKAGTFAPVMLLGNYTSSDKFEWNLQCIVYVEDN